MLIIIRIMAKSLVARAGWGVSPTSPWIWATLLGATNEKKNYNYT